MQALACGTSSRSPSALQKARSPIGAFSPYMWIATPSLVSGEPAPAIVTSPSTKSVGRSAGGSGSVRHRCGFGCATDRPAPALKSAMMGCLLAGVGVFDPCATEGTMRYSHERWFVVRGHVNADPENCSAYSPSAQTCGEFCVVGSAPASASVRWWLPKPDW